ncbi:hypothetical protein G7Z17_g3464 [Cylindrodendrum hubeiense]|uniref:Uncharacterized protein n=1 Tax=Cylindrodendrum hubeiense TaxID=595255 RepID=A0A9P5HAV6_9HYPO|nr:hypothetical protein G7Z17_g3464 [Cylindrodendrum hubeiense]
MIRKVDDEPYDTEPDYVHRYNIKRFVWFEMGIFTRWNSSGKCQVLCVDTPFDLPDQLKASLEKRESGLNFEDPFAMHVDLIDLIIKYYDLSVWLIRDPVRKLEQVSMTVLQGRPYTGQLFEPMHDISRHAIHTAEILSVTIETFQEMLRYQTAVYEKLPGALGETYLEQAKEYMKFQIQLAKSLKLRSDSTQKRLENEVNLAFNSIANQDNTVMKSIALLTMVQALFSTAFFNFGDDGWEISTGFWIYWVVTIPITAIVIVAFRTWIAPTAQIQKILGSFTRLKRS